MLEETGYASDDWHLLGSAPVCPAFQSNRISTFLALHARLIANPSPDEGEMLSHREMAFDDFISDVETGNLALPSLQLAGLWWLTSRFRSSAAT